VLDFFVLAGDANHDRAVDTLDFNALAANFGGTGKTYSQADFNYDDGVVDTLDFNALAASFGRMLAPPATTSEAGSAAQLVPAPARAVVVTAVFRGTDARWRAAEASRRRGSHLRHSRHFDSLHLHDRRMPRQDFGRAEFAHRGRCRPHEAVTWAR
jgi:hypothetical protein